MDLEHRRWKTILEARRRELSVREQYSGGRDAIRVSQWGEIDITVGTMVVTVEFITVVVGTWWGGFAEQGGQTQPPTSLRENMDLRVSSGSPELVELPLAATALDQGLPNFMGTGVFGICWANRSRG